MEVTVTEDHKIKLTKVFNSIILESEDKEEIVICMRHRI